MSTHQSTIITSIYQIIFQIIYITRNHEQLNCSFSLENLKGEYTIEISPKTSVQFHLDEPMESEQRRSLLLW